MSENPLPKEKIFDVMKALDNVVVKAPIKCRDVVVENVCGTHVNIIATRTIKE